MKYVPFAVKGTSLYLFMVMYNAASVAVILGHVVMEKGRKRNVIGRRIRKSVYRNRSAVQ